MSDDPFAVIEGEDPFETIEKHASDLPEEEHHYTSKKGKVQHRCATDKRGHAMPRGQSIEKIRVDSHLGFVPLWAPRSILKWRFNERSFRIFQSPEAAKQGVRRLMSDGIAQWQDAVPVSFSEQRDMVDFEVVMMPRPDCDASGCVLASAFFPDSGRHKLAVYPTMFRQSRQEQVETMAHEFGHIFGLRHWFAHINETSWPAELFGEDTRFSIMNYGADSAMNEADIRDLKQLYQAVWSGRLRSINGTPVRMFRPFSTFFERPDSVAENVQLAASCQSEPRV